MRILQWAYGLILALLPTYMVRFEILGLPTTLLEALVGLFLVTTAAVAFGRAERRQESWNRIRDLGLVNWAVGLFLLGAAVSTAISPETVRALGQLKAFFLEPVLMFYAGTLVFRSAADLKAPLRLLFASAAAISAFGIVQYHTHLYLPLRFWGNGEEIKRITSVFEYPNALALYLAPLLVLFAGLVMGRHWQIRTKAVAVGLGLMTWAVLLTGSRGAWLGIVTGLALLLAKQAGVSWKKFAVIMLIGLTVLSPVLYGRVRSTFSDGSSGERVELLKAAGSRLLDSPLLGNGLYGFRTTLENNPSYHGEILNYPHNILLNFWLEIGLLGLLGFALVLRLALARGGRIPAPVKLAAAGFLMTVLVHGLVDAPYFKNDLSLLFWFAISIFYTEK